MARHAGEASGRAGFTVAQNMGVSSEAHRPHVLSTQSLINTPGEVDRQSSSGLNPEDRNACLSRRNSARNVRSKSVWNSEWLGRRPSQRSPPFPSWEITRGLLDVAYEGRPYSIHPRIRTASVNALIGSPLRRHSRPAHVTSAPGGPATSLQCGHGWPAVIDVDSS